jgi:hypothetical protein
VRRRRPAAHRATPDATAALEAEINGLRQIGELLRRELDDVREDRDRWRERDPGGDCSRAEMARRFPPPWSVEETEVCYIVRDANGQALAYVYFEEEPGRSHGFLCCRRDLSYWMQTRIAECECRSSPPSSPQQPASNPVHRRRAVRRQQSGGRKNPNLRRHGDRPSRDPLAHRGTLGVTTLRRRSRRSDGSSTSMRTPARSGPTDKRSSTPFTRALAILASSFPTASPARSTESCRAIST